MLTAIGSVVQTTSTEKMGRYDSNGTFVVADDSVENLVANQDAVLV